MLCCLQALRYEFGGVVVGSVRDAHLFAVPSSPDLMLAALAMFDPPLGTGKALELLVCHGVSLQGHGLGVNPSELCHHLVHLVGIDGDAIPAHPITGLHKMATDLPVSHAADELIPGGLVIRAELDTCLSGVVEEFIVADPQGSIPGLVGCPTVVSGEGGSGHVVWVVWYERILEGQAISRGR